ncbi:MAG: long-chain acyl-CoA synthetase, partial [Streblomastix strix]
PAVFHGYYRDRWQTRDSFDDGDMNDSIPQPDETEEQKFQREKRYNQNLGWFRTGDVGYMDSNGNLVIIDRVKDIFKLAQGEYVAPDVVEQLYGRCPYILHSYMYGESSWRYAIAIVVPNEATIMNKIMNETQQNDSQRKFSIGNKKHWIEEIRKEKNELNRQEKQINSEQKEKSATNNEIEVTLSDLLPKHETEIKQFILYEMNEVAKSQGGLSSFQLAADILLLTDQMGSIQAKKIIDSSNRPKLLQAFPDECITPSLKLKRFMVAKMYQNDLHECYERVVARREGRL